MTLEYQISRSGWRVTEKLWGPFRPHFLRAFQKWCRILPTRRLAGVMRNFRGVKGFDHYEATKVLIDTINTYLLTLVYKRRPPGACTSGVACVVRCARSARRCFVGLEGWTIASHRMDPPHALLMVSWYSDFCLSAALALFCRIGTPC